MPGVPPLELRLPRARRLMDKAKEDHILEVELSLVHHHRRTHLDPSQERQVPHLHLLVPIQEPHLGSSHPNQMCHIPTQGPPLDSNQMCHILQDPIQEPLLDSSLHQMLHTLQHPSQGLQLGQTQELLLAHSNQEPHLASIQEPLLGHSNQGPHLALIREPLLGHSNQEPHLALIREPLLGHSNQEPHLALIREPLLGHSNQEPHLALIREPLLGLSNQEPHLALIRELLLAHNSQEPHLANSNQEHLGNIPILQGRWDLVVCQGHIPTLLVNRIQILLDHIRLHLALMVSLVPQVLHLVGQGGIGNPRVGSTPHSLICHIQLLLHFQLLVLMLHLPYPGARCHPVSGGQRHHFLELLDHTRIEAIPEVAEFSGPVLGTFHPAYRTLLKNLLLEDSPTELYTRNWVCGQIRPTLIFRHVTTSTYRFSEPRAPTLH